jgi:molybdopterin converting factor small subunit
MDITVQLLSPLKERAGAERLTLSLPQSATVEDLLNLLSQQVPELKPYLVNAQIIINQEIVYKLRVINEGDEIILFAPVFGG